MPLPTEWKRVSRSVKEFPDVLFFQREVILVAYERESSTNSKTLQASGEAHSDDEGKALAAMNGN